MKYKIKNKNLKLDDTNVAGIYERNLKTRFREYN